MNTFKVENKNIGADHPCFVIAEIGQNHQGDVRLAKEMIKIAKVFLQMLVYLFS
jgi:N-acetylneuraminate synthase